MHYSVRYLTILMITCWAWTAKAADPEYAVNGIPAVLKEKAHAVLRKGETLVRINDLRDVRVIFTYAITILDANGRQYADLTCGYDKLTELKSIHGTIYNAEGKQVKKIKTSDFKDQAGTDEGTFISDDRVKQYECTYNIYPYTVEYEVEQKYNHTFALPSWRPQPGLNCAVQQRKLIVETPAAYSLRHRAFNYAGAQQEHTEKDRKFYTWEVKDLPALEQERFTADWWETSTAVLLAPDETQLERYKGNMRTWEQMGKFVYQLTAGRDKLPEPIRQKVHQLTDGMSSETEKINTLYRYLQQQTRYIGIQLGIGGWQPFEAADVMTKGYGDCKGLSNCMYALLKEAGIRSYYTLVRAGETAQGLVEDFPRQAFNHAILCVPQGKDTIWLECTSQFVQPGYMGGFTGNRSVLLIDENGGKLVRTPAYGLEQNLQVRHITAQVQDDGNVRLQCNTRYTGIQQDELFDKYHHQSREELLKDRKSDFDLPSYDIDEYKCTVLTEALPAMEETVHINARGYATVTGKRIFLQPNLLSKGGSLQDTKTARRTDIRLHFAYRDIDTVRIAIPHGYSLESLPKPVTVQNSFGKYETVVKMEGQTLVYTRKLERTAGTFPAAEYSKLTELLAAIYRADRNKVVLVKQ